MQCGSDGWQAMPTFEQKMPSGPLPQERQPSVQAVQVALGPFANLSSRGLASTLDAGAPKSSVLESLETRGRSAANVRLVRSDKPRRPINTIAPTMAAVLLKRDTNFLRNAIIHYVKAIISRSPSEQSEKDHRK